MLFLRAVFLEILLCVHVLGAAVLFRRLFPRESPWLCLLVPTLSLLAVLNFLEHFIALTNLGWLLPLTVGGALWILLKPGFSWEGLRFPAILFVATFTFTFGLKCIAPVISNATEGVSNLTRVLNYCLGGTLPEIDCFLPPYDYGIYYSFQHYGAAILKRLFSADLGTAYNVSYAFLLAWLCVTGAGVAHAFSGKIWISLVTLLVLFAASTGSAIFFIFFGPHGGDYGLSTALNVDWDNPSNNPFAWICAHDASHPGLLLQAPTINLYWSEFHATMGGNFLTFVTLLAAVEIFRRERSNWPWICLVAMPMLIVITSAWFFLIVSFLCASSLAVALIAGRRPQDATFALVGSAVALVLLWPSVYSVTGISSPEQFRWTNPDEHTPLWMFLVQWWPVFLPWLLLCFVWDRLDLKSRWIHLALPILFIGVEFITFGDRKLTTEKMWAGIYGAGLITLLPMVFMQKGPVFRVMGVVLFLNSLVCFWSVLTQYYGDPWRGNDFFHLRGDAWIREDAQKNRLVQVLSRLHAATILPGRSYWDFSQSPAIVDFSENRCFVAYTFHEYHCGRGAEGDLRSKLDNQFYDGTMPAPLAFLRGYDIDAVLIWPEDTISDALLAQFKKQLGPEFFYVDCKLDEPNNAGVFFRQKPLENLPPTRIAGLNLNSRSL